MTGSPNDRAVTRAHDIGIRALRNQHEIIIGKTFRGILPGGELLPYVDAILRVYNLHGRRDSQLKRNSLTAESRFQGRTRTCCRPLWMRSCRRRLR